MHQNGDENRLQNGNLLEDFGIDNKHFQNIFSNLITWGIALSKILYDEKGLQLILLFLRQTNHLKTYLELKENRYFSSKPPNYALKKKDFCKQSGIV